MPTATILVQGKADPERGKKRGRIKSDTGMIFQADPGFLGQMIVGSRYDITYRDDDFNGAKFRVIEGIVPSLDGLANQRQAPPTPKQPAPRQTVPMVEDRRGEDIATLAIAKEWIGRIPVGDQGALVHALRIARRGWLQFKNETDPKIESGPSMKDDMADEIPEL